MYAKLVYSAGLTASATRYATSNMIRDIVRLCTSPSPNVNNLVAFSNTSSVIIDNTPAGWSLVYSNGDGTVLPDANTDANAANTLYQYYWAMSAPCLGPGANNSSLKYAKLTTTGVGNANYTGAVSSGFAITTAASVSNTGTVTGETYRCYYVSGSSSAQKTAAASMDLNGNGTYHIIATQRHLTIIKDTSGYQAVWEGTVSDYHTFYNIPSVITTSIVGTGTTTAQGYSSTPGSISPTLTSSASGTQQTYRCLVNITDPNTGTNYSSWGLGAPEYQSYMAPNYSTNMRTVAANGLSRNLLVPIMYQFMSFGIPTCFVTDVCDMYWCQGGIGTTGDTFTINGSTYTYFDGGTSGLAIGTFG
jgi:hypothetical protein